MPKPIPDAPIPIVNTFDRLQYDTAPAKDPSILVSEKVASTVNDAISSPQIPIFISYAVEVTLAT